jgi:ABC-type multidrug transport system fused ATPase/permease subunit
MKVKSFPRLVIAACVVLIAIAAWYRPLQEVANTQIDAGLKRAVISFASARTLNAAISVIQGTEFSVEPMGVGVTLTPGQILDPINDLVEQFSTMMLVASVAFGVQKVMLAIGAHMAISASVTVIAMLWATLFYLQKVPTWLSRLLVVLIMVRFAVPLVTVGSDWIFEQFLAEDYGKQLVALDATSGELSKLIPQTSQTPTVPQTPNEEKGLLDRMKDRAAEMIAIPKIELQAIKRSVELIPERVMRLIVVFLMQTIIVPIILLWALYRIAAEMVLPSRLVPLGHDFPSISE